MKKNNFKILLILGAILFSSFFAHTASADSAPITVEFQNSPLFSGANFVPGDSVTRWIKVTNNTSETKKIATESLNAINSDHFGDALSLSIKEGGTVLYSNSLSNFFTSGEKLLSEISANGTKQYDYTITFATSSSNDFQGKNLSFDIVIGFQGTEGSSSGGGGGGGGGGYNYPPVLTIVNESRSTPTMESVTITWDTSYPATSYVIFGRESEKHSLDLSDTAGTPPKYGYGHATIEDTNKVTSHSVTVSGLESGVTYYYRAVSHGSLAIGGEQSFKTLTLEEAVRLNLSPEALQQEFNSATGETIEIPQGGNEQNGGLNQNSGTQPQGEILGATTENVDDIETIQEPAIEEGVNTVEEERNENSFMASIGNFLGTYKIPSIILLIILLLLIAYWVKRKIDRKGQNNQTQ